MQGQGQYTETFPFSAAVQSIVQKSASSILLAACREAQVGQAGQHQTATLFHSA